MCRLAQQREARHKVERTGRPAGEEVAQDPKCYWRLSAAACHLEDGLPLTPQLRHTVRRRGALIFANLERLGFIWTYVGREVDDVDVIGRVLD